MCKLILSENAKTNTELRKLSIEFISDKTNPYFNNISPGNGFERLSFHI